MLVQHSVAAVAVHLVAVRLVLCLARKVLVTLEVKVCPGLGRKKLLASHGFGSVRIQSPVHTQVITSSENKATSSWFFNVYGPLLNFCSLQLIPVFVSIATFTSAMVESASNCKTNASSPY